MRLAVRAPLGAAMHGVLVKGFLLFRRELRVEILDGLVAGGHASLMLGLHGLHAVEPFRRRKTLKLGAVRALGGRGGRLHGAGELVPRVFLCGRNLQALFQRGHALGVALGHAGMALASLAVVAGGFLAGRTISLGGGFAGSGHLRLRRSGCNGHQSGHQKRFAVMKHGGFLLKAPTEGKGAVVRHGEQVWAAHVSGSAHER